MVNKEAFAKRLQNLMDFHEISAAGLADKIGVQRSSISHLLSGRNNPSLDFVLRVLDNYPEIQFDWLVKGEGKLEIDSSAENENNTTPTLFDQELGVEKEKNNLNSEQSESISIKSKDKSLDKILLLYTDGSFDVYKD